VSSEQDAEPPAEHHPVAEIQAIARSRPRRAGGVDLVFDVIGGASRCGPQA
jgi:hypothetical protein